MFDSVTAALSSPYGALLSGLAVLAMQLPLQRALELRRKVDPVTAQPTVNQSDTDVAHHDSIINNGSGAVTLDKSRTVNQVFDNRRYVQQLTTERRGEAEPETEFAVLGLMCLAGAFASMVFLRWMELAVAVVNAAVGVAAATVLLAVVAWLRRHRPSAVRQAGSWCLHLVLITVAVSLTAAAIPHGELAGRSVQEIRALYATEAVVHAVPGLWREFGASAFIFFGSKAAAVILIADMCLRELSRSAAGVAVALRAEVVAGRGYQGLVDSCFPGGKPWRSLAAQILRLAALWALASGATATAYVWMQGGGLEHMNQQVLQALQVLLTT